MSYIKAAHVLPQELLTKIQEYVDGEFIYIPRIPANKRDWGEKTTTRRELQERTRVFIRITFPGNEWKRWLKITTYP